jgi:hypothetical protein
MFENDNTKGRKASPETRRRRPVVLRSAKEERNRMEFSTSARRQLTFEEEFDLEAQQEEDESRVADQSSLGGSSTYDDDALPLPQRFEEPLPALVNLSSIAFRFYDLFQELGHCVPVMEMAKSGPIEEEIIFHDSLWNTGLPTDPSEEDSGFPKVPSTINTTDFVTDDNDFSFNATFEDLDAPIQQEYRPADLPSKSSKEALENPNQSLMANISVASSSHDYTQEDVPRPIGESIAHTRKVICFLILLVFCMLGTIGGVGFAALAKTKKSDDAKLQDATTVAAPSSVAPSPPDSAPSTMPTSTSTNPSPSRPATATPITLSPTLSPTLPEVSTPPMPPTFSPTIPEVSSPPIPPTTPEGPIILPSYPSLRFVPWQDVAVDIQRVASNFLGYTETTWNLPGSANNNGRNDRFWEGRSFANIQQTAHNWGVISTIAQLGFETTTWDCWINHYQNFTWDGLSLVAPIEIVFVEGNNTTTNRQQGGSDSSVTIGGRDIQGAMATLGWNEESWMTLERFRYFFPRTESTRTRPLWGEMSVTQQRAATMLCYTKELWDQVPVPEWNDGDWS